MSLATERKGRRTYFIGDTFAHRRALKDAGCHWDGKGWWIGNDAKATELATHLSVAPAEPRSELLADIVKVIGRALYKGKPYLLLWEGTTRMGQAAKLATLDGTRTVWANASEVTIVRRFEEPTTFGKFRRLWMTFRAGVEVPCLVPSA